MKRTHLLAVAGMIAAATPIVLGAGPAFAAGNTRHVSTTGTDTGDCISSPCKTVNYALSQSLPYDTIKVAAGSYNQTVDVEKPINLVGAGAANTIIDGTGMDPGGTLYGVLYVGTTGGAVKVRGFTFENPVAFAYTGGQPEVVALKDTNSNDLVTLTKNIITEGSSDANASTEFPIGLDTFQNAAQTIVSANTISGTQEGALFEDNGPVRFTGNTVTGLISGTDNSTSPPTVYPAVGVFFLSDLSGSVTGQQAANNTFKNYGGYGLVMEAGYNNGNCSTTPCNGSISGQFNSNHLALTPGAAGTYGMVFEAKFSGNDLSASAHNNDGFVTSPTQPILVKGLSGASITVTEANNAITMNSSAAHSARTNVRNGGLHIPKH